MIRKTSIALPRVPELSLCFPKRSGTLTVSNDGQYAGVEPLWISMALRSRFGMFSPDVPALMASIESSIRTAEAVSTMSMASFVYTAPGRKQNLCLVSCDTARTAPSVWCMIARPKILQKFSEVTLERGSTVLSMLSLPVLSSRQRKQGTSLTSRAWVRPVNKDAFVMLEAPRHHYWSLIKNRIAALPGNSEGQVRPQLSKHLPQLSGDLPIARAWVLRIFYNSRRLVGVSLREHGPYYLFADHNPAQYQLIWRPQDAAAVRGFVIREVEGNFSGR